MNPLEQACVIARHGFRTCFTHSIGEDGKCTCRRATCPDKSWGKHPVLPNWQKVATDDVETLRTHFERLKFEPNVSVVLGPQSDGRYIVAIDNDDAERMGALVAELGPLPPTLTGKAPRGLRTFYALPPDAPRDRVRNVTGLGGVPGVDVKAAGGHVVVAGRNARGVYTEFDPSRPVAELPAEWTLALLAPPRPPPDVSQYTPHTLRDDERKKRKYTRYLERAVTSECGLLARTREGSRNSAAFNTGIKLFALANGMHLPAGWAYVRNEILAAAQASGLPQAEALKVVRNAERAVEESGAVRMPREAPPAGPEVTLVEAPAEDGVELIDDNGQPARIAENVARMLARYSKGAPRLNMMSERVEWSDGKPVTDADELEVQAWLMSQPARTRVRASVETVHGGILLAASRVPFEPVQSYLKSLVWDGTERVRTFASTYLGAKPGAYSEDVTRWFLVSAVARAMAPGCQVDTMMILEGPQGAGKTSLVRTLAGDGWSSSSHIEIGRAPDCYQQLRGVWLYELGEVDGQLASHRKQQELKAYMSATVDSFRPSYGRNVVYRPRRNVFIGTTNESDYLVDATGARRYHGLRVGAVDLEALARDRDQVWAEAVHLYRSGVPWWPSAASEERAAEEADERYAADPWEERIRQILSMPGRSEVRTNELLGLIGLEVERQDRAAAIRVGIAVRRVGGWKRVMVSRSPCLYVYRRTESV